VGLLLQWGSALALLAGDPAAEGLGASTEGCGLALLGGAPVAAGLGAGVEG
jgi:hypothetical protein